MHHTPTAARLLAPLAAWLALASSPAHAVVEAGHWSLDKQSFAGSNLAISVDQTVSGDYTGTFFNYNAATGTLQYVTSNIDEGSQLFITRPGEVLTNASITALPSSASLSSGPVVGKDFYLGARTRSASDPGFSWSDPSFYSSFGWAHFKLGSNGKLQIVDSAMAFREIGIMAGTTQAVPEPSTGLLVALGLGWGTWIARRRKLSTRWR